MKLKVFVVDLEIRPHVKKWGLRVGIPFLVLSVAAVALAEPIVFTDGQTLTAAELNTNVGYLVPSGAVVSFNLSACPTGWSAYAAAGGRTIIGVNPADGNGLSQRNLGDTPGEETHTMTLTELVSHTHGVTDNGHTHSIGPQTSNANGNLAQLTSGVGGACGLTCTNVNVEINSPPEATNMATTNILIQPEGNGSAFNNMQPSVALLYCQKD